MEYPISLYYEEEVSDIQILDVLCNDDDYRKVYIVNNGGEKNVIKHMSNTFVNGHKLECWFRLMDSYRKIGLYCPSIVPNRDGKLFHCDLVDGREYYTYAEEFSIYETAEEIGKEGYKGENGMFSFSPDLMRSLGKIAAERLDFMDWPTAYCLLEPFSAPDTTDEATEAAIEFTEYVRENLPQYLPRAEALLSMFYQCQEELRALYSSLPTSCFQGDLHTGNILLDKDKNFVGLIDFNLCGKEPILNYVVREALWNVEQGLFSGWGNQLYLYNKDLDDLRIRLFLSNIRYIQEYYDFTPLERNVFPVLFRYMNSFWGTHVNEIESNCENDDKIKQLFDWLEYQMTRDDIRLP